MPLAQAEFLSWSDKSVRNLISVRHSILEGSLLSCNEIYHLSMKNKVLLTVMLVAVALLGAVPAFAMSTRTPAFMACMQNAVTKRDDAIIAAVTVHQTKLLDALKVREQSLVAAWGMADEQASNAARKTAWRTFHAGADSAKAALKDSKDAAWKQFSFDRQNCGAPLADKASSDSVL